MQGSLAAGWEEAAAEALAGARLLRPHTAVGPRPLGSREFEGEIPGPRCVNAIKLRATPRRGPRGSQGIQMSASLLRLGFFRRTK